eukprot:6176438-Pleurochrysis_carterae.AAC.1
MEQPTGVGKQSGGLEAAATSQRVKDQKITERTLCFQHLLATDDTWLDASSIQTISQTSICRVAAIYHIMMAAMTMFYAAYPLFF